MAGWPLAQPRSAVLVSLPGHSFFVPFFYLSAFQLLLIQTSTSVAGVEFDPIPVEIVIPNLKKKKGGEGVTLQLCSLFSVLLGSTNLVQRKGPSDLKPLYHSLT